MQAIDEKRKKFTLVDYCQYLICAQTNYTITNLAEHLQTWSHDVLNKYLRNERITAKMLWDNASKEIQIDEEAYLIFDDSVLDKNYSFDIELVKYQYSGNAHDVIKGIGVVNCVYVNPKTGNFWIIDYRIYNPDADGYTKIDHVKNMLINAIHHKKIPFKTILMDTWYASTAMMMFVDETIKKIFYFPVKTDRLVDDLKEERKKGEKRSFTKANELTWTEEELKSGKLATLKRLPNGKKVKLFRIIVNNESTVIATNDFNQNSSEVVHNVCKVRWKVEQFHREIKQLTGIEKCQCRKARIQRNHVGAAILVWNRLKKIAYESGKTIYTIKKDQLRDYLIQQLRDPSVRMVLA